jgi:UDP-3-O-[3-hydroxymyristoyl] glucosamine N-acyltransferase
MSRVLPSHSWRDDFPDSRVSTEAQIGSEVRIGPGSVVHADAIIGDGTVIGECCVLGHRGPGNGGPLLVGPGSTIRSHTVLYAASTFGPQLETGHHVVIRENTTAGENLRVGNFNDIEGDCTIGDFCRFHGYAHVGKGSRIGNFVWLFSLTTATNDPLPPSTLQDPVLIEDGAVVCVGVTIMPGTIIGKGAFISAGAVAKGRIPVGAVIAGMDGRVVNHVSRLMHLESGTRHPWMRHYERGFPPQVKPRLDQLLSEIMENRMTLLVDPQ